MRDQVRESVGEVEAWIVGGALRDELLGRPVVDVDVALAEPEQAARRFARSSGGAPFPLSERHWAWRVALDGARTVDFTPLRERERRAAGAPGEPPCRPLRLGDRDVEIDDRPAEELVANRSADNPGLLFAESLPHLVTHRRPSAARGSGPRRSRRRART